VPTLSTLVLSQNNVAELADLEVLRGFKKLTFVSLVDNPVTNKEVRLLARGSGDSED
jgi:U2 small nuclear ribonucleoprotein A'